MYEKSLVGQHRTGTVHRIYLDWIHWWPIKATLQILSTGSKTLLVVLSGHNQLQPRSSTQTASVTPTNRIYQCIVSYDLLMRYTPHSGHRERPTSQTNTLACQKNSFHLYGNYLYPYFSFLQILLNLNNSGAERLICLLNDTSLFNHRPNSHPNTCSKPWSISACQGNRIGLFLQNLHPNKTKRAIQPHCHQPLFSLTGSAIKLSFYVLVAFINEASHH